MAQKEKLTHTFIDKIKPTQERMDYADTDAPGLYLRVSLRGVKTFSCVFKQSNGRTVRSTLGRYPQWSVEAARKEARRLGGEIARGLDLAGMQKAQRDLLSLGELFDMYERDRIAAGKKSTAATRQIYERWVGRIPDEPRKKHGRQREKPAGSVDWSARRADAISQHDVATLLERMKAQGLGVISNRVQEIVSATYEFAKRRKLYVGDNPAQGIEPVKETQRTRFLQSDEFPRFLEALKQLEPDWRDYFTLLLLVGYRRRAVASMRWTEVDLDVGVWHVPVALAKNGEPVALPLVGEALQILKRRKKGAEDSPYVFPGRSAAGHMTQPKFQWARLRELAELQDLNMHDLRRSLGSWLAMSGHSLPQIGRVLGHKDPKSTAIYARLQMDAVASASAKAQAVMLKPRAKVIPMKRKRG